MDRLKAIWRIAICGSLLSVVLALAVSAQDENFPPLTLRASTHFVLLDVVVTAKNGDPVSGLHSEDFSLKEDGKVQKITSVNGPAAEAPSVVPALPPGVYSNAPVRRLAGAAPTVIVIDAANTSYQDQLYARARMLKYLGDQYKPGQRIAVFTLTDKLSLLQDFTGDPQVLAASLKRFSAETLTSMRSDPAGAPDVQELRVPTQVEYANLVSSLERFEKSQAECTTNRRAELTLEALRRINRILGGLPGRKNVVWLTGGFPFALNPDISVSSQAEMKGVLRAPFANPADPYGRGLPSPIRSLYGEQIREVAAHLATSQVAIYPVDVQGLIASAGSRSIDRQESMREIAEETGGKAFVNQNDIENGLALAERDRAATYTLGYYPSNKKFDHKYRSIELKVNRSGIETTYRRGYFPEDTFSGNPEQFDGSLAEAWHDGAPDTLVTFEAKLNAIGDGKTRVEFLVDPRTISFTEDSSGRKLDVGFYVAACSSDDKILAVKEARLNRSFTSQIYQQIAKEGMYLHLDVDAVAGANGFRVAVRDNRTGYIGTLTAQLVTKP